MKLYTLTTCTDLCTVGTVSTDMPPILASPSTPDVSVIVTRSWRVPINRWVSDTYQGGPDPMTHNQRRRLADRIWSRAAIVAVSVAEWHLRRHPVGTR